MLCDGSYEEAQNLTTGVSLMSLRADGTIVQNVEIAEEAREVYDMEIEDNHNFALSTGVFVHNSKDGADSLAGAVFLAHQHVEEFLHEYGYATARLNVKANSTPAEQARIKREENPQRFSPDEVTKKLEEVKSQLMTGTIMQETPDKGKSSMPRGGGKRIFVR